MSGKLRLLLLGTVLAVGGAGCEDDDGTPTVPSDGGPRDGGGDVTASPDVVADTGGDGGGNADLGPASTVPLTILHTNDLHSHLMGHAPEADYTPATVDDDETIGGFARLAAAIGARKLPLAGKEDVLTLDGGDFMMGTLFQLAATRAAAELRLMQALGYDAVAMGNHELDWTPKGLAGILKAAIDNQVSLPVLASNLNFNATSADDDLLEMLKDPGPLKRKFIKTLTISGLKVGFFGLLGKQAQSFAPTAAPLTFAAGEVVAQALVQELRNVDKVDLVIALSHSGIDSTGQGEDRALAKAVNAALAGSGLRGIDVIVSGHTHQTLATPAVEGPTVIVTAGSYGSHLGALKLNVNKRGDVVTGVSVAGYDLVPLNDKIKGDETVQGTIDGLIALIDQSLAPLGLAYRKPVAQVSADISSKPYSESGLGDLITDAYLAAAQKVEPDKTDLPVLAVEVNGQIRAPLLKGKTGRVWLSDLYRVSPLGIGPDGVPGAPLVTYYLNGADLKTGLEISAAAEALGDDVYTMQFSGLQADIKKTNLQFQRVVAARVTSAGGAPIELDLKDTTKCYKVTTTLQLAGLFGLVETVTKGLLPKVQAKQKDCTTPADIFTRLIDADPVAPGVQELKHYQAVLGYLSALPDTDADGIPNIPATYNMPGTRSQTVTAP